MRINRIINYSILGIGATALTLSPDKAYALASVDFAIQEICSHMEGNLGGLLFATAGVGALISAAFGNIKAMYTAVVAGVGAFTISAMLSLYFPDAASKCSGGGGGGGGGGGAAARVARTKSVGDQQAEVSRFNVEKAVKMYIDKGNGEESSISDSNETEEFFNEVYEDDSEMELF